MSAAPRGARRTRGPRHRRLPRAARRELLIDAAMPLVAERGMDGFGLEELADRVDVTRNLLYHYFPRGRDDVLVAVAERAGHELTDGWVIDESIPLEQRMAANFLRVSQHSREPSHAWRIYRMARNSPRDELRAVFQGFQEGLIELVSENNLGTRRPPPLARMTIKGFLAFTETLLDEAREMQIPPEQALQVIARTALAAGEALRSVLAGGPSLQ